MDESKDAKKEYGWRTLKAKHEPHNPLEPNVKGLPNPYSKLRKRAIKAAATKAREAGRTSIKEKKSPNDPVVRLFHRPLHITLMFDIGVGDVRRKKYIKTVQNRRLPATLKAWGAKDNDIDPNLIKCEDLFDRLPPAGLVDKRRELEKWSEGKNELSYGPTLLIREVAELLSKKPGAGTDGYLFILPEMTSPLLRGEFEIMRLFVGCELGVKAFNMTLFERLFNKLLSHIQPILDSPELVKGLDARQKAIVKDEPESQLGRLLALVEVKKLVLANSALLAANMTEELSLAIHVLITMPEDKALGPSHRTTVHKLADHFLMVHMYMSQKSRLWLLAFQAAVLAVEHKYPAWRRRIWCCYDGGDALTDNGEFNENELHEGFPSSAGELDDYIFNLYGSEEELTASEEVIDDDGSHEQIFGSTRTAGDIEAFVADLTQLLEATQNRQWPPPLGPQLIEIHPGRRMSIEMSLRPFSSAGAQPAGVPVIAQNPQSKEKFIVYRPGHRGSLEYKTEAEQIAELTAKKAKGPNDKSVHSSADYPEMPLSTLLEDSLNADLWKHVKSFMAGRVKLFRDD